MAEKTSVKGNRVTIEDAGYDVKVLGAGKHVVFDEFGGEVGRFVVTGRKIETEDYGVEGIHSVDLVAKLWFASTTPAVDEKAGPASKMVCRMAHHDRSDAADLATARVYQAWLKKQPGVRAAFFTDDAASKKTVSISVWDSRERLTAFTAQPPGGAPPAPKHTSVEILPLTDDL